MAAVSRWKHNSARTLFSSGTLRKSCAISRALLLDKLSYFKQAESNEKAQKEQTADTLKEESKLQGQCNVGYPNGDNDYCHNDHGDG